MKNVNSVGIVLDGKKNYESAKKISENMNLKFINIIPSKEFNKNFVRSIAATPTTLFVDSKENILETRLGSYGKEGDIQYFKNKINELLHP